MLASLLIVFREVIEAGLIVGIVLAATQGLAKRGMWIGIGVASGLFGACLVAGFADQLASLFAGSGQELFNATVLFVAVLMLTWHNVWMSSHGKQIAQQIRELGAEVVAGRRTLMALSIVVGVAVLREGSEVVLFLYGIAAQGGLSALNVLGGGALGLVAGAGVSALMYYGLLTIPAHRLFAVTSWLITLLAAGMAAQSILFLQQAGYLEFLTTPVWDSSWLLADGSIPGRMLHTLIGYTDSPNGAQLIAYGTTVISINALMRIANVKKPISASVANPAT